MNAPIPVVGSWYRHTGGELFEVVAIDDDDATIEVQHYDGTVEEIDFDSWEEQWTDALIEAAQAPDDWTGSVDVDAEDVEDINLDNGDDRQWSNALDYLDHRLR